MSCLPLLSVEIDSPCLCPSRDSLMRFEFFIRKQIQINYLTVSLCLNNKDGQNIFFFNVKYFLFSFYPEIKPILCDLFKIYFRETVYMSISLKQGTKNNVIIIPGGPHEQTRKQQSNAELVQINTFNGDIDHAITFYISEINKLSFDNSRLTTQLRKALEQKKEIADMIASFEEISKEDTDEKKKRIRRCANQIERNYICQVIGCEKSYGTQGSMAQHMKLKHPEIDYAPENHSREHKERREYEDNSMS